MTDRRWESGDALYLRHLHDEDINDRYVAWFTDPEVTQFLDARNISREDALAHLAYGRQTGTYELFAICLKEGEDRHIGNLKIGPIARRHMTSDLVTVIGDRSAWGHGHARTAIKMGIRIAFEEMNIRKLSASIDSDNIGSIKAYTGAGFEIETKLAGQYMHRLPDGPRYTDKVYISCFNPNYDPDVE